MQPLFHGSTHLAKIMVALGKVALARFWPSTVFQTVVKWFLWPLYDRAPLPNQSQNQTSHSHHNLTLLKNKSNTHSVKRKLQKYHFSLLFGARVCGSLKAAVFTYNLNGFNHLATSCSSLMFKCGVPDGLRSFQKK